MILQDDELFNDRSVAVVAFLNRPAAICQADVLITPETEFPTEMLIGVVGSATAYNWTGHDRHIPRVTEILEGIQDLCHSWSFLV